MPIESGLTQATPAPLKCIAIITCLGRKIIVILSMIVVLALTACSDEVKASPKSMQHGTIPPPLVAPFFNDQTGSSSIVLIDPMRAASFDRIIAYGRMNGCDIALGAIRSKSNRPLVRLFIDTPEAKPLPPADDNLYAAIEEDVAYKAAVATWQRGESERLRKADVAIATFRSDAEKLLAHPANAHSTDLNGAIERARLFLNERRAFSNAATVTPMRAAIFMTDGIETASKAITAKPLDNDVIVIVVNDTSDVLPTLHPIAFEAFSAATNWLCHHAEEVRR
jgi:hypothetical protein